MKILMCNSFHYVRGGAERYFLELSELLTAHGHSVIPFCMQDERNLPSLYTQYFTSHIDFPSQLRAQGIGAKLQLLERVIYSREAYQKITQLIAATQPDIAHIHGIAHETSPSILPAIKQAGLPIVQTLHDYKLLCPNTSFISQGKVCEQCKGHNYFNVVRHRCKRDSLGASLLAGIEMYTHKLFQIYEKHVDLFLSPSKFLLEKVQEFGITNPIAHLPYFINLEKFQPCYEPNHYFVFSGRLVEHKGVNTLLQAMKLVRGSHLYIAGRGELEAALRAEVDQEKLTNVTFLGHVETPALITLLQKAAFMVAPSEWYENYALSILEAFACGTPVIGSQIGGIPEQVVDGVTGLLFEPGNAQQLAAKIQTLIDNPNWAIQLGRNARQQVERVNHPQSHNEQLVSIYQNLILKQNEKTNRISRNQGVALPSRG